MYRLTSQDMQRKLRINFLLSNVAINRISFFALDFYYCPPSHTLALRVRHGSVNAKNPNSPLNEWNSSIPSVTDVQTKAMQGKHKGWVMEKTSAKKAAQYIRMSTDLQRYSTANQIEVIAEYATDNNLDIIETYVDEGKSGLRLSGRKALQKLLADVISGQAEYEMILVYDISRWGRFQDNDESAHYEFLCRKAGKKIIYCAEIFLNDGTPAANIIKGLKRAMAGEYSRELSEKVFRGQSTLAKLGWHVGAPSPYGLRRMMVDKDGTKKETMEHGQRKSLQSDKVILVPGPDKEIKIIRKIFHWFITEKIFFATIARRLNCLNIEPPPRAHKWSKLIIKHILQNEKYVGNMIYNQTSERLSGKKIKNPPKYWIRHEDAFDSIISKEIFLLAQKKIKSNIRKHDDEHLLKFLRKIFEEHGRISASLLNKTAGAPCSGSYRRRFGTIEKAYAEVGFYPNEDKIEKQRKQFFSKKQIVETIQKLCLVLKKYGASTKIGKDYTLIVNDAVNLQVTVMSRTNAHPGHRIFFQKDSEIILAIRNDNYSTEEICELFVFPRNISNSKTFYINKKRTFNWFSRYRTTWETIASDLFFIIDSKDFKN